MCYKQMTSSLVLKLYRGTVDSTLNTNIKTTNSTKCSRNPQSAAKTMTIKGWCMTDKWNLLRG